MTVIVLDCAPESVRGELCRWLLELKPGVFVGNINARIRELLWERICATQQTDGGVIVYPAKNEQGFEMKLHGEPRREVIELEGVQLIKVVNSDAEQTEAVDDEQPSDFSFPVDFLPDGKA